MDDVSNNTGQLLEHGGLVQPEKGREGIECEHKAEWVCEYGCYCWLAPIA